MERSIILRFNNAGVLCFEAGQQRMAWDLFKGALEVRLLLDKQDQQQQLLQLNGSNNKTTNNFHHNLSLTDQQEGQNFNPTDFENEYIQRAREHLLKLEEQSIHSSSSSLVLLDYNRNDNHNSDTAENIRIANESERGNNPQESRTEQGSRAFIEATRGQQEQDHTVLDPPFLYKHPVPLEEYDMAHSSTNTRMQSATIIYNLALVHHLQNQQQQKRQQQQQQQQNQQEHVDRTIALYELALYLIAGTPVGILSVALVNNMGVWCFENHDREGTLNCMNHLCAFMQSGSNRVIAQLPYQERKGLEANVLWLALSLSNASPAA